MDNKNAKPSDVDSIATSENDKVMLVEASNND